jgi:8-oxo-dGTP pyrophosphatase MutT (NUDIX family)
MNDNDTGNSLTPAEQIALWADTIRDLSATGLRYAATIYDRNRYTTLQQMAMEMMALVTNQTIEQLEVFRELYFSRSSPMVAGAAAVINHHGEILLMQRADNHAWSLPAGGMEVGETAAAVVRETYEETGIRCAPIALVGVYDSRLWGAPRSCHTYKFTFLCTPIDTTLAPQQASHAHETETIGWFDEQALPDRIHPGHRQRIIDAFRVWRGETRAHFDP